MDLGLEGGFLAHKSSINFDIYAPYIKEHDENYVFLEKTGFETVFSNDILPFAKNAWCNFFKDRYTNPEEIFHLESIVDAVNNAPRNRQTAELHIQMIKYADELKTITSKEFCEETKLPIGYGSEFSKMRNITERLKAAGLDVSKL